MIENYNNRLLDDKSSLLFAIIREFYK